MADVFRICAIALLCAFASAILGHLKSGISFGVKLAGGIAVLGTTVILFGRGIEEAVELFGRSLGDEGIKYARTMVKALGIAYVSGICASLCRDIGEVTAADGIETVGKLTILTLAVPIIGEILDGVAELLGAL